MVDLESIKDELVSTKYADLKQVRILMVYADLGDAFFQYGRLLGRGYRVEVDHSMRRAPTRVVAGGMGHELSHIATDRLLSLPCRLLDGMLYLFSERYEARIEMETDIDVINRGLGHEFLEFLEYAHRKGMLPNDIGISLEEARRLVKSFDCSR